MKKIFLLLPVFLMVNLFAQEDSIGESLEKMYENKEFEEIITYAYNSNEYSSKSLTLIGKSFFHLQDDQQALDFFNRSIEMDEENSDAHYYRGMLKLYSNDADGALLDVMKALAIHPDSGIYLSGLGDIQFIRGDNDEAKKAYLMATELDDVPHSTWMSLGNLFSDEGNYEKELSIYYIAKDLITEDEPLSQLWFKIGLTEFAHGSMEKAQFAFDEVLNLNPNDGLAKEKIIQTFYQLEDYSTADMYRQELYDDFKNSKIHESMKDGFFFDQFTYKNYNIMALERFQEGVSSQNYPKHIFYVKDKKDSTVLTVQSEYSSNSKEKGFKKFSITYQYGDKKENTGNGFDELKDYPWLKNVVLKIIEENLTTR